MIPPHADDVLTAADREHLDEYLAALLFDYHGADVEPYSRALLSAVKLQQWLLLDGCAVLTDADERLATVRVSRDGRVVEATAATLAEALSLAALAWARVSG